MEALHKANPQGEAGEALSELVSNLLNRESWFLIIPPEHNDHRYTSPVISL
jgi:hypothetical protein